MLDRLEEALICLKKCKEIAYFYDMKKIIAKSLILEAGIMIKQNKGTYCEVIKFIETS